MAIWVNPKKKTYASTGPTAWLKRYVEHAVEAMRTELREKLSKFPIRPDGEQGGAVLNDVASRAYDEEGRVTAGGEASGKNALAAGTCTTATGSNAVALGEQGIAEGENQLVHGSYNISDTEPLHIVGNGTDEEHRSNAYVLDKEGNGWFAGAVTVGSEKESLATQAWTEETMKAELAKKADITWLKGNSSEESEEEFYAKLDNLVEDGVYGLQYTNKFRVSSWKPDVEYLPIGDEYVIVTSREKESYPYAVRQWYFGAEQGMKMRSGTIAEDGTVIWEDWVQFVTQDVTDAMEAEMEEKMDIIVALEARIAALEGVDATLQETLDLQETYIGGEE